MVPYSFHSMVLWHERTLEGELRVALNEHPNDVGHTHRALLVCLDLSITGGVVVKGPIICIIKWIAVTTMLAIAFGWDVIENTARVPKVNSLHIVTVPSNLTVSRRVCV